MAGAIADLANTGYALETTPGVYVAPSRWLAAKSNTLAAKADTAGAKVMSGSVNSGRINRPTKEQMAGQLVWNGGANTGAPALKAVFASDAYKAALTADSATAYAAGSNNALASLTLANAATSRTYAVGQVVAITDTTAGCSVVRAIQSVATNGAPGTVIKVANLPTIYNGVLCTWTTAAVTQISAHQLGQNAGSGIIPTISVEVQDNNRFAHQWAGVYAEKLVMKGSKDLIDCTLDVFGTVLPVPVAPTTPAPTAGELSDFKFPFTIVDGGWVGYTGAGDSTVNSTSVQGALVGIQDWTLTYNNNLQKEPTWDWSQVYRAYRGAVDATIQFTYINEALGLAEWRDYVRQLTQTLVPMSFAAGVYDGSAWRVVSIYAPTCAYLNATPVRQQGKVVGATVDMAVQSQTAQGDMINVYLSNADATGY